MRRSESDGNTVARKQIGERLKSARISARERYKFIAEALKAEAGVRRHYTHKVIGGLAWSDEGKILAPEGITRRQLYVLAHECGHVVLHSGAEAVRRPNHIKEHEAEVYAHRAFARYGLEVPPKSAQWARNYVGEWILKEKAEGIAICPKAADFAAGKRSPEDPLPSVDGLPPNDFSRNLDKFIAKGTRTVIEQESNWSDHEGWLEGTDNLPNACATCWFFDEGKALGWHLGTCKAFAIGTQFARNDTDHCNYGRAWRPHPELLAQYSYARHQRGGFWRRLGDAIINRISGARPQPQKIIQEPRPAEIEVKRNTP